MSQNECKLYTTGKNAHRLHIGHRRRTTKQSNISGERWLQPWFALFTLERLYKCCLLAANVCAGAAEDIDVELVASAT